MADRIKTLEEARQLLKEYNDLPDDLTTRLNWSGFERLPYYTIKCPCGYTRSILIGLDDLQRQVDKGELTLEHNYSYCFGHDDSDDDDDD